MWAPASINKLELLILHAELKMDYKALNLWNLIKVIPQKWQEKLFGDEDGGFWVVASFGNQIIYYNDIEDGFNISTFEIYGVIEQYICNQSELTDSINYLVSQLNQIPDKII
ncbi:MAG: hypothetical protein ACN6PN_03685 [Sphingobacterium sp.]